MNYQMTELAHRAEERCKGRFEEIDRIAEGVLSGEDGVEEKIKKICLALEKNNKI